MEIMREVECVLIARIILMVLTARDVNQASIDLLEYPRHLVMPVKVQRLKCSVYKFFYYKKCQIIFLDMTSNV